MAFMDRPPAGAQVVDFFKDTDPYPKPFRSGRASAAAGQGGLRTTDIIQRFTAGRNAARFGGQYILDPQVLFDETYAHYVQQGATDEEATAAGWEAASRSVEHAIANGMDKAAARLQPKLESLRRYLMNPNAGFQLPIGASRPDMGGRAPGGMSLTGTGVSPSARHPVANGTTPRAVTSPDQIDTYTFRSADGNEYTFTKKVKGQFVPDFTAFVALLTQREVALGGDWRTVLAAARISLADNSGAVLFHPDDLQAPAAPEPATIPPGMVEVR